MVNKHFVISFLILLSSYGLFGASIEVPACKPCRLKDMFGEQPMLICQILEQLLTAGTEENVSAKSNRLLLHGDMHTGKTQMARSLAVTSDRKLIEAFTTRMTTGELHSEIKAIGKMVNEAQDHFIKTGQRSIIFIDCINSWAHTNSTLSYKKEGLAKLIAVMNDLRYKDIFFVCATCGCYESDLSYEFTKEFPKQSKLQLYAPQYDARLEAIAAWFKDGKCVVEEGGLEKIAQKTSGYSMDNLRHLSQELMSFARSYNGELITDVIIKKFTDDKKVVKHQQEYHENLSPRELARRKRDEDYRRYYEYELAKMKEAELTEDKKIVITQVSNSSIMRKSWRNYLSIDSVYFKTFALCALVTIEFALIMYAAWLEEIEKAAADAEEKKQNTQLLINLLFKD